MFSRLLACPHTRSRTETSPCTGNYFHSNFHKCAVPWNPWVFFTILLSVKAKTQISWEILAVFSVPKHWRTARQAGHWKNKSVCTWQRWTLPNPHFKTGATGKKSVLWESCNRLAMQDFTREESASQSSQNILWILHPQNPWEYLHFPTLGPRWALRESVTLVN